MAAPDDIEEYPGFRRRFVVTPSAGAVTAAVEDDYHCMAVTLRHDGTTVTAVDPVMQRAPWTTCPSAVDVVVSTFTGVRLDAVAARGEKWTNCTHLHDLAVLGAAHSGDDAPTRYDVLVSDPVDGVAISVIRRDAEELLRFEHRDDVMLVPESARGVALFKLRDWIDALDPALREPARILQWASMIAHGRLIPLDQQSDATRMPANCHTFQPERVQQAKRVGRIIDFSGGDALPLDHFDGARFGERRVA